MQAEELTIQLRKPITIGKGDAEKEFTEITLCEPTAGQMEMAMKAGQDLTMTIELIRLVANVPRQVVAQMGMRDLMEAGDFLAGFSATNTPPTGEISSQM